MSLVAATMLTLGCLFLIGLVADIVGRKTGIPRVTLLLLFGLAMGPYGVGMFPEIADETIRVVSTATLAFVSFLLGAAFERPLLLRLGRDVLVLSVVIATLTSAVVVVFGILCGLPVVLALLLGAIATATDPIATRDVIVNSPSSNTFGERLTGVVAIDDAWGIIAFSIILALAQLLDGATNLDPLVHGMRELGGGLLLGLAMGIPMAFLTGRIAPGEPTLVEAGGFVLLCAGLAEYFGVSMLLSAMVMGAVTANFARHHKRPFRAIEGIEWPLLVAFFFLIGATVQLENGGPIALVVTIYCVARTAGRILGGWLGGRLLRHSVSAQMWYGPALLPQAGVALGMALVGAQYYPELGTVMLPAVVIATVVFELIGPIMTRVAIGRVVDG